MRILLVDDDQYLCQLTKKVLTNYGHSVSAFGNASMVIAQARQIKPHLILMDVILPGLSGPEIVKLLKSDSQLKEIPVVFLTSLISGEESGQEGLEVGGVQYPTLGKPYEIEHLLRVVQKYAKV